MDKDVKNAFSGRIEALDSLRGIAALVVVFSHCYLTWPEELRWQLNWIRYTPLRLFINGHASVIIFFVLSGYVLALPFLRGKQPDYPHYLIKRICRIYIPFFVSIFLAALLYQIGFGHTGEGTSQWLQGIWPAAPPDFLTFMGHLLMVGTEKTMSLNTVMWSLVYEMRISIIFPLLMLLCRSTKKAVIAGIILYVVATGLLLVSGQTDHWLVRTDSFLITWVITARFIPFFMAGILISKHAREIHGYMRKLSAPKRYALLLIPLLMFPIPHSHYADVLYGVGAVVLVILAVEAAQIRKLLEAKALVWLGHISYSLYLLHLPILILLFRELLGILPYGAVVLVVLAASLTASALMNRFVEMPAMALGRKLAKR
ncbi:MAG: acyltransferase [Alphaproteobacteria bacterium]|nr:acyltransferase [Alphaproteobacteria bacterium]